AWPRSSVRSETVSLANEDFGFAEKALKGGKISLEALYRAMQSFEHGTVLVNSRLAPYLVRSGVLTPEALYEILTQPAPAPPEPDLSIPPTVFQTRRPQCQATASLPLDPPCRPTSRPH